MAMKKILVINGPNLNRLGRRNVVLYGTQSLADIEADIRSRAAELNISAHFFQSNCEGDIVTFIQEDGDAAAGCIINAGALTQTGYSVLDALLDVELPFVEVHISNIYARETFRQRSVFAPYAKGQISGLGVSGYRFALEWLASEVNS